MPCIPFPCTPAFTMIRMTRNERSWMLRQLKTIPLSEMTLRPSFPSSGHVPASLRFRLCQPAAFSSPRSTASSLGEPDSPLAIRPHAKWIASRKLLSGCCSGQARSQGACLEVHPDVHNPKQNRVDTNQPDNGEQPRRRLGGNQDAEDD